MNTKQIFAAVLAASALTLSACGKDTQVGRAFERISDDAARETMKKQVFGNHWTACQDSTVIGNPFDLPKVRNEIGLGSSLQRTTTFFGAGNCDTTPAISVIENGNYEIGSAIRGSVYEINESYQSVAITPLTDEGKQALINRNACGTTDWVVGVQKVVTGDTANAGCWTQTPRQVYDIVERYQTGLQFGKADQDKNKSTPGRRPTELDPALRFDTK